MTPEEVELVIASSAPITAEPATFSAMFYDTLFELEPTTRALFPAEMHEQRTKLVAELRFMISAATAYGEPDALDDFVARAHELGHRHVGYGVTATMYEPVTAALMATLRDTVADFNAAHEQAWTKLFHLVSETMLEGASTHR